MNMVVRKPPFVGPLSTGNGIKVQNLDGRIGVRILIARIVFILVMSLGFGALTAAMLWSVHTDPRSKLPQPWWTLVAVLCLACWSIFLRTIAGTPRFECNPARGDLRLFRFHFGAPMKIIPKGEIDHFEIQTESYYYKQGQTVNYVLELVGTDGSYLKLCASADQKLIQSIGYLVASGMNRQLSGAGTQPIIDRNR